ncbi:hypothetical protein MSG28_007447, partial [Choristoneura fumiferana]
NIWRPRRKVLAPVFSIKNLQGFVSEFARQATIMTKLLEQEIVRLKREELATLKSNNEPVENKTFLDMIIDSSSKIKGYSDVEVREEVIVIMSAGSDTSAVGTGYTAVMLSRYPEVQEKVYQELEEVFGNNSRPVTAADLPKLVYLEAVVKETLRLYPPVPIYVRETHSDCKLPNGLTVPKGVALLFLLHGMHRNPKYWGDDAEQFRPERFFEGSLRHPVQFIPFSYSVRNCLVGPAFMENRPALKLKIPLLIYNVAQVLYSAYGMTIILKYGLVRKKCMIDVPDVQLTLPQISEHSRSANSCTTESLNEIITSDAETGIKYRRLQNKLKEMLVSKPRSKESYLSKETLELLDERRTLISNKGDKERRQKIANLSKEIKENMRRDRKEKIHRVLEENIKRTGGTKKAMKQLSKHGKEWISKQKQSESYLTNRLSIQKLATEYYRLLYSDKFDLGLATIPEVNESKENKVDEVPEILASELNWDHLGLNINGARLNHLRFADDLVLLEENPAAIEQMMQSLANISREGGLEISAMPERENLMNLFKKAARIANDQGGLSSFWLGPKLYIESALGVKMNSQQNSDHRFMKAFEKVSHLVARRIVTVWMHPDVIYKNLPIYKEFKESRRVLFDFVDKLIQNKREELKNNNNQLYDQNWMNLFKKAARIANNQGGLSSFWMGPKLYIVVTDPETVDVVLKSCMDKDDTTMRYCRTLTGNGSIFAAGGRRTFLEMMIMGSGGERGYTDLELREEVLVIILAGTDTSAVGASYASVLLSRFPNVQEKVYEELQDVFGDSDRPLTVQDLPNLKYLDAVMKETLRMYPPVPVTVREVHNDVVLPSGVTLVDGVSIFNNIWGIHRNPKYWGADADVFRPERFLDGYNYAMMSMKTVIANLVRAYKVLPPKDMNPAQLKEPLRLTKYVFYRIDSIPIWRPRRKILAPTFSMKNLNQFVEIFAQQSNLMTELLRPVAGKGDFSIWKYMNTYSFDSVCESALGVQMNSQQNSDHRFMKAFEKVSHLIARRIVSIWMHPDVIYKSLPIYKVFKENRRVLSFKLSVKN